MTATQDTPDSPPVTDPQPVTDHPPVSDLAPVADIAAFLDRYAGAWATGSADAIAAFWDAGAFQFYKAEEISAFYFAWSDVYAYWRHNEGFNDKIRLTFSGVQARRFAPGPASGLITAAVRMHWDIRFSEDATLIDGRPFAHRGKIMGGDNHVLCLLRADPSGSDASHPATPAFKSLKLCGWSETPDAPITYMAGLYRQNVTPGFEQG